MGIVNLRTAFSKYRGMNVVVPWSGGVDSTIVLASLAHIGANVTALSFVSPTLANHLHEEFARDKLREVFESQGLDIKFERIPLPTFGNDRAIRTNFRWKQKALWLSMLPLCVPSSADFVVYSMVSEDNVAPIPNMKQQWKAMEWNKPIKGRHPKLVFPVERACKADLIDYAKSIGLSKVVSHVTYCDSTFKAGDVLFSCGKCDSCLRMRLAELDYVQPIAKMVTDSKTMETLVDITKWSGDEARFFMMKENADRNHFFFAINAQYGDGCESSRIQHDSTAVVYLGTGDGETHHGVSFFGKLKDILPRDVVVINDDEYVREVVNV